MQYGRTGRSNQGNGFNSGCGLRGCHTEYPGKDWAGERLLAGHGRHQGGTGATQSVKALLFVVKGCCGNLIGAET
jgi:hypothetical protein